MSPGESRAEGSGGRGWRGKEAGHLLEPTIWGQYREVHASDDRGTAVGADKLPAPAGAVMVGVHGGGEAGAVAGKLLVDAGRQRVEAVCALSREHRVQVAGVGGPRLLDGGAAAGRVSLVPHREVGVHDEAGVGGDVDGGSVDDGSGGVSHGVPPGPMMVSTRTSLAR